MSPPSAPDREQLRGAELFAGPSGFALVYARRLTPPVVTSSGRHVPAAGPARLRLFVQVLTSSADDSWVRPLLDATNSACGIELERFTPVSQRFSELRDEGRASPELPLADELTCARVLADRDARRLAIAIKASGGLLVGNLRSKCQSDLGAE